MKISDYTSGRYTDQYQYKSFSPSLINLNWSIDDNYLISRIAEASRLLGELNAFSSIIPDMDFFISMHIAKEATESNRIEGTKTTMEEVFADEDDIEIEKRDDRAEVRNYIEAINYAISELKKLPLSNRLIKNTHQILLKGVRGETKTPGEFRKTQNWIGPTLKNAFFVPPHHSELPDLMSDFELFMNNEEYIHPELFRIALLHYQFETIHPFLDGNGRIGRLLITLYLVSNNVLNAPSLYLSDFLEKNKGHYFNSLTITRQTGNLNQWLDFFMSGVIETSKNSINVFKKILIYKDEIENIKLPTLNRRFESGKKLMNLLFRKPILEIADIPQEIDISLSTANRLVKDFVDLDILREYTGYSRNRKYIIWEYLDIYK
jgi:Fic family protein